MKYPNEHSEHEPSEHEPSEHTVPRIVHKSDAQ